MAKQYDVEFKKQIALAYMQGASYSRLEKEYGVAKPTISGWTKKYSEECQHASKSQPNNPYVKEIHDLNQKIAEVEKENLFLKKSGGILREGTRLETYQFLNRHREEFGTHWLLQRLSICSNAYYNYLKQRNADYHAAKEEALSQIQALYHHHNGVPGYRTMTVYLRRKGYSYSPATIHAYMNQELGLRSIVRPKKPAYAHGKAHEVFENKLNQDFQAQRANQKWRTDFTYLFLKNHEVRHNCGVLDLHDRGVVASLTDRGITSDPAIRTLKKALEAQPAGKGDPLLHSDQGAQHAPKAFVEFCESKGITQSMGKAGYPYDNAPMERYFNTLKNEYVDLYGFETEEALYQAVERFSYVHAIMSDHTATTDIEPLMKLGWGDEAFHGTAWPHGAPTMFSTTTVTILLDHYKHYTALENA